MPDAPRTSSTGPPGRAPRRRRLLRPLVVVPVTLALAASAGAAVVLTRPPDGGAVGGLDLSGLDRPAAVRAVQRAADAAPPTITLRPAQGGPVEVPVADLGVRVDAAGSVARARPERSSVVDRLTGRSARSVDPVLVVDEAALSRAVEQARAQLTTPDAHGGLSVVAGRVTAVPAAAGRSATAPAVRQAVLRAFGALPPSPSSAVDTLAVAPHGTTVTLDALAAQAQALVDGTLTVTAGNRTATVSGAELAPALTVSATGDQPGHDLRLDLRPEQMPATAERVAAELGLAAVEPTFSAPAPQPLLSDKGDASWSPRPAAVTVTRAGVPGQAVAVADVLAALRTAVGTGSSQVSVPATPVTPAAVTPGNLIGTFTSAYACCEPRVTNIRLIARAVDGTVVAPGAEFSLNGAVGPRTRAKGYVDAPFILDGELSTDVGGGVSQFATTLYNAAYFAGLPVLTHKSHSFYISRYPPGREATVNYPSIDLRWRNDTGAPVLIRTTTDDTRVTVGLYGDNGGRVVRAISGPRVPVAGADFRITVTRQVTMPDSSTVEDRFTTTYAAPPAP